MSKNPHHPRQQRSSKPLTQHQIARRALASRLTHRAAEIGRSYLPPARTTRPAPTT